MLEGLLEEDDEVVQVNDELKAPIGLNDHVFVCVCVSVKVGIIAICLPVGVCLVVFIAYFLWHSGSLWPFNSFRQQDFTKIT